MKRAHRKFHFIIWLVLAPIIFTTLYLAVTYRSIAPVNETLPAALVEESG